MLAPERQEQIAAVVPALARFAPARVAVEWPAEVVAERYPKYLDGALPPSRNEVVQLGFRLGKATKAVVEGIDVDGDFPYGWYRRNFMLCARLAQAAKPGDRIVVLYGSGHAHLLRQCVEEVPGWKLVEPDDYLPG
jgi:hypothetical protein